MAFVFTLAGLICLAPPVRAQQIQVDYIFLVDVSGSMSGKVANSKDVFDDVRKAIKEFGRQLDSGTNVVVVPFAGNVGQPSQFTLRVAADRNAFEKYLDSLQATGNATGVYKAVAEAVKLGDQLRAGSSDRIVVVQVYTDGKDNASTGWNLESILSHFNIRRGPHDWLYLTELGLPPDPAKEAAFRKYPRMRYVQSADVKPIRQVQTLLPVINFGNLKTSSKSTRVQKYSVKSRDALPASFSLSLSGSFADVSALGARADVVASTLAPTDAVNWTLSLTNPQSLKDGQYKGEIVIEPSDPSVIVVPDRIQALFAFEDPHVVRVGAPPGVTSGPLDFGSVATATDSKTIEVPIEFSPTAIKANDEVVVELVNSPGMPGSIVRAEPVGRIPVTTKTLRLRIAPQSRLAHGSYSGQLRFRSAAAEVTGPLLAQDANGDHLLTWQVSAPYHPALWWALAALLGSAIAGAVFWTTRPATFKDLSLEVLEPTRQVIDAKGMTSVAVGRDTEWLGQIAGSVEFVAIRAKRPKAVVRPRNGDWRLKRPGAKSEVTIVADEPIFDGDVLSTQGCRVRVASYSLDRTTAEQ